MRVFFMAFLLLSFCSSDMFGQATKPNKKHKTHKIVFQVITGDTTEHKSLMRQLNHMLTLEPKSLIEVVCHGPGLDMLMKESSVVLDKLAELANKKVDFVGCEATMARKNIDRTGLIDQCRTVPGGMMEIVYKQEAGYSYIKAGY